MSTQFAKCPRLVLCCLVLATVLLLSYVGVPETPTFVATIQQNWRGSYDDDFFKYRIHEPSEEEVFAEQRMRIGVEMAGIRPPPAPRHSLVVTTWRSGSTFLGDVLLAHPATFYHYEPLLDFGIMRVRGGEEGRRAVANLRRLLRCDYSNMERYLDYGEEHPWLHNHNTRLWWICNAFRDFCSSPEFLGRFCALFPFQAIKTVRLALGLTKELLADRSLSLRAVLLVRDPRAVLASRRHRDWCPGAPDCEEARGLCGDMEADHRAARALGGAFPGRLRVVRYEDLSFNVTEGTKELLRFFKLSFTPSVEDFLRTHTSEHAGGVSSTYRNSSAAPLHWRNELNFTEVASIQAACRRAMALFGYREARDPDHLLKLDPVAAFVPPV